MTEVWTDERKQTFISLWNSSYSIRAIAKQMGMTRDQVQWKAQHFRAAGHKLQDRRADGNRSKAMGIRMMRKNVRASLELRAAEAEQQAAPLHPDWPPYLDVIESRTRCRFIADQVQAFPIDELRCCGQRTHGNTAYCQRHQVSRPASVRELSELVA